MFLQSPQNWSWGYQVKDCVKASQVILFYDVHNITYVWLHSMADKMQKQKSNRPNAENSNQDTFWAGEIS